MISPTGMALLVADDGDIDPTTGHGPEWGKAAPIALLVIVLLGIALVFLLRSMNKQMHKVPASFDPSSAAGPGVPPPATDASADTSTDRPPPGPAPDDAGSPPPR